MIMFKHLTTTKRAAKLAGGLVWAYRTIFRIDAFNKTDREVLKPLINEFCQRMTAAIDLKVVETNTLPQGQALWVSNHISWVDIVGVGSKVPAFFIAKAEIGGWPVFGPVARAAGTVLIKRGSGDVGSITDQIAAFLKQGVPVLFYPEGTTSMGRSMRKLYPKLFEAATRTGTAVHPMVICYQNRFGEIDDAIPYAGGTRFMQSIKRVLENQQTTLFVRYLAPISSVGKTRDELTAEVESAMRAGLKELHLEVFGKTFEAEAAKGDY